MEFNRKSHAVAHPRVFDLLLSPTSLFRVATFPRQSDIQALPERPCASAELWKCPGVCSQPRVNAAFDTSRHHVSKSASVGTCRLWLRCLEPVKQTQERRFVFEGLAMSHVGSVM